MTLPDPDPAESAAAPIELPRAAEAAESDDEPEQPLNRAARRARAKQQSRPTHVGPRPGQARNGKAERDATSRPL